jgi:hypothetical protein
VNDISHSYEDLQHTWNRAHQHDQAASAAAARIQRRAADITRVQKQLAKLIDDQEGDQKLYEQEQPRAVTLRQMVEGYCAQHNLQLPPEPARPTPDLSSTSPVLCDWASCGAPIEPAPGLGEGWKHVLSGRPECSSETPNQYARPAQHPDERVATGAPETAVMPAISHTGEANS